MKRQYRRSKDQPWGQLAALIVGTAVAFIGVVLNLDPDVILQRAVAASVTVGLVAHVLSYIVLKFILQSS